MKSEDDENGVEDENGIDDENGVEDEKEEENKPSLPCPHCKRFFWYKKGFFRIISTPVASTRKTIYTLYNSHRLIVPILKPDD